MTPVPNAAKGLSFVWDSIHKAAGYLGPLRGVPLGGVSGDGVFLMGGVSIEMLCSSMWWGIDGIIEPEDAFPVDEYFGGIGPCR